jgi:hypothetical protein
MDQNVTFSIDGLQNPAEVAAAWQAVLHHRHSTAEASQAPSENRHSHAGELDAATAGLAERIHRGLTLPVRLEGRYALIFRELLDAPQGAEVRIEDLSKKIKATTEELRANTSKLSARMRRIATPEELATHRTPFLLLADLTYNEKKMARYTLTPAGRDALRRFLGA